MSKQQLLKLWLRLSQGAYQRACRKWTTGKFLVLVQTWQKITQATGIKTTRIGGWQLQTLLANIECELQSHILCSFHTASLSLAFVVGGNKECHWASVHRYRGEPIPRLTYTSGELHVWNTVLHELRKLFPDGACAEYLRCFPMFDFREDAVSYRTTPGAPVLTGGSQNDLNTMTIDCLVRHLFTKTYTARCRKGDH